MPTEIIPEKLWIGNRDDVKNYNSDLRITHIFNVAADVEDNPWNPDQFWLKVGLHDGDVKDNPINIAVDVLEKLMNGNNRILIHCYMGFNRAPFVVAKYLSKVLGGHWTDHFLMIQNLRPGVYVKAWMFNEK